MAEVAVGAQLLNLNATPQSVTLGPAQITNLLALNTTGVTVFIQLFDAPASQVTLGTTKPVLQIPLAATTGEVDLEWDPPWLITSRLTAYATTDNEGNTGAADGVFLQALMV